MNVTRLPDSDYIDVLDFLMIVLEINDRKNRISEVRTSSLDEVRNTGLPDLLLNFEVLAGKVRKLRQSIRFEKKIVEYRIMQEKRTNDICTQITETCRKHYINTENKQDTENNENIEN